TYCIFLYSFYSYFFFLLLPPPPRSTLFPYTTLFRSEEVSYVNPSIIRRALRALKAGVAKAGVQIEVTMEATHHGPTSLSMPVCFVEIGSGESEWTDPILGEIAANAVISAIEKIGETYPTAVGFGGTHYSAK